MAYDSLFFKTLAEEFDVLLSGRKIEKINQHTDRAISFSFSRLRDKRLYVDISPSFPRVLLSEDKLDNPFQAPMFQMLLRKKFSSAVLKRVRQINEDRILEFCFEARNELSDISEKYIIVEIMGKHSNLILADENYRVIDALKHVSPLFSRRSMGPGVIYSPPFSPKPSLFEKRAGELAELVSSSPMSLHKAVYTEISCFSPQSALSLLIDAGLFGMKDAKADTLGGEELNRLAGVLEELARAYEEGMSPRIYKLEKTNEISLSPLRQYEAYDCEIFDSANDASYSYFKNKASSDLISRQKTVLLEIITSKKNKEELKLSRIRGDIEKSSNYDEYRIKADALMSSPQEVKKGASSCKILNYYDNSLIEIELDSGLSAYKNAANYYKLYEKNKRAVEHANEQLIECRDNVYYLDSVLLSLEDASGRGELEEIESELISLGYIKPRREVVSKPKKKHGTEFRSFTSPGGFTIRLGRNNIQNDELTTKISSKNHIWFHTKGISSAHLVLSATEDEVTEDDIIYAARLTAYYSKARFSENVPVDYCLVKYVKKPSGSPPGKVIYSKQRTVYVEPLNMEKDDE